MIPASLIEWLRQQFPEVSPVEATDVLWLASLGVFSQSTGKAKLRSPVEPPAHVDAQRVAPPERPTTADERDDDIENEEDPATTESEEPEANLSVTNLPNSSTVSGPVTAQGSGGMPLRAPAARALPRARELARAMRPFRRPVASRRDWVIDERDTAHSIAETRIWLPTMRPARERHYEIALVIDASPSLVIWRDMLRELRRLLEHNGGFRDVRLWWLDASKSASVVVRAQPGGTARNPRELIAPDGKRLIVVVSDCLASGWEGAGVRNALAEWGRYQAVAILQVLPQTLWARTALNPSRGVVYAHVGANAPGVPNRLLTRRAWRAPLSQRAPSGTPFPTLSAQPELFAAWAKLLHSAQFPRVPAVIFKAGTQQADELEAAAASVAATAPVAQMSVDRATELIREFRFASTPLALRLAQLFAAAPLRLPVMRLVQRALLPESGQTHLAEFFLSGLIFRETSEALTDPDLIDFEFLPHVRQILLDNAIAIDAVKVQRAVSKYIGERFGQVLDFDAILETPSKAGQMGATTVDRVFARVSAEVLRRMGGQYARAAELLARSSPVPKDVPATEASPFAGKSILWVDDAPQNNTRFAGSLLAEGARIFNSPSTDDALRQMDAWRPERFDAVISDLGRPEDDFAGLVLMDEIRNRGDPVPFAIFSRQARDAIQQADDRGAIACSTQFSKVRAALREELKRNASSPPTLPPLLPEWGSADLKDTLDSLGVDAELARPDLTLEQLEERWGRFLSDRAKSHSGIEVWQLFAQAVSNVTGARLVEIWHQGGSDSDSQTLTARHPRDERRSLAQIARDVLGGASGLTSPLGSNWVSERAAAIRVSGKLVGAVCIGSDLPRAFTPGQCKWLDMIARAIDWSQSPRGVAGAVTRMMALTEEVVRMSARDRASLILLRAALRTLMLQTSVQLTPDRRELSLLRREVELTELWIISSRAGAPNFSASLAVAEAFGGGAPSIRNPIRDAAVVEGLARNLIAFAQMLGGAPFSHIQKADQQLVLDRLLIDVKALPDWLVVLLHAEMMRDRDILREQQRPLRDPGAIMVSMGPLWPDLAAFPEGKRPSFAYRGGTVWVATSADSPLSRDSSDLAERLGYVLAVGGFTLVFRHKSEFECAVAEAFVRRMALVSKNARRRVAQVIAPSNAPLKFGGRVIEVEDDRDADVTCILHADAVVLVDERGSHYPMADELRRLVGRLSLQKLPVLSLPRDLPSASYDDLQFRLPSLPQNIRRAQQQARWRRVDWQPLETPSREKSARLLFAQGVVGVFVDGSDQVVSGVILREPRVILVCEAHLRVGSPVKVVDRSTEKYSTAVLRVSKFTGFEIAILRVPDEISAPGLELSTRRLPSTLTTQVVPVPVEPWPPSVKSRLRPAPGENVVSLNATLGPHARGAPVLDPVGRVTGVIINVGAKSAACFLARGLEQVLHPFSARRELLPKSEDTQQELPYSTPSYIHYACADDGFIVNVETAKIPDIGDRHFTCPSPRCGARLAFVRESRGESAYFQLMPRERHAKGCMYGRPEDQLAAIFRDAPSGLFSRQLKSHREFVLAAVAGALRNYTKAKAPYLSAALGMLKLRTFLSSEAMAKFVRIAYGGHEVSWEDFYYERNQYKRMYERLRKDLRIPLALEGRVLSSGTRMTPDGRTIGLMILKELVLPEQNDPSVREGYMPEIWSTDVDAFEGYAQGDVVVALGFWQPHTGYTNDPGPNVHARGIRAYRNYTLRLSEARPAQVCRAIQE